MRGWNSLFQRPMWNLALGTWAVCTIVVHWVRQISFRDTLGPRFPGQEPGMSGRATAGGPRPGPLRVANRAQVTCKGEPLP